VTEGVDEHAPRSGLLDRARSSRILHGSVWILVGLAVQASLGFVFWLLGARVATSDELGRASALFTAIQFVNYASGLGLTVALARFAVDRTDEADALFGWGVVATVVSSSVGGALYLLAVDTPATALVTGSAVGFASFCAYTAASSVMLLVDLRLMAARRWGVILARIAAIGLVRLPIVVLDVDVAGDVWLFHLLMVPMAIIGAGSIVLLPRLGAGRTSLRRPATLGIVSRYAGVNWVATLASQAPQFVLPLIVAQSVAASINASFFLAWTVTGLVLLLPGAVSQVLLVEGSRGRSHDAPEAAGGDARAREALAFSLGLATLAWLGSLVAGPVLVAIFGDEYERLGRLLPLLMFAGIPWAITSVALTQARIRRDQLATVAITATLGLGIVVPALILVPDGGTSAATQAWLLGNVAAALVAMVVHRRATGRLVA
jgi:O-antigen/teichoic acid export membrane protein